MIKENMKLKIVKDLMDNVDGSFEKVYQLYKSKVYFIGFQFFKNQATAEDVVQETFIIVHQKINQLNNPEAFSTWLQKIAYQRCLKIVECDKNKYIDINQELIMDNIEDMRNEANIKEVVKQKELLLAITSEIKRMKPAMRCVAYLRIFEEMSIKEIAEVMNIPEGTVKSRMSRIRRNLKGAMDKFDIDVSKFKTYMAVPTWIAFYSEFQSIINMNHLQLQKTLSRCMGMTMMSFALVKLITVKKLRKMEIFILRVLFVIIGVSGYVLMVAGEEPIMEGLKRKHGNVVFPKREKEIINSNIHVSLLDSMKNMENEPIQCEKKYNVALNKIDNLHICVTIKLKEDRYLKECGPTIYDHKAYMNGQTQLNH
ncbi:MAG: RNA polymerase sigma factor [Alphaproteobacteria bacterium]